METALGDLTREVMSERALGSQQTGETHAGSELVTEMTEAALMDDLQERLAAVARAEARIEAGTFGRSVESGARIPGARLEADPLAERTVEEQRQVEERSR